jgi:Arc/MetJ-type ribon-helix-helix transcriptional regulator
MDVRLDSRSQRLIEKELCAGRYHSPEEVVARALETLAERESTPEEQDRRQAVQDMMEFAGKHRFTLGEGLRVRDLIHEGHKH